MLLKHPVCCMPCTHRVMLNCPAQLQPATVTLTLSHIGMPHTKNGPLRPSAQSSQTHCSTQLHSAESCTCSTRHNGAWLRWKNPNLAPWCSTSIHPVCTTPLSAKKVANSRSTHLERHSIMHAHACSPNCTAAKMPPQGSLSSHCLLVSISTQIRLLKALAPIVQHQANSHCKSQKRVVHSQPRATSTSALSTEQQRHTQEGSTCCCPSSQHNHHRYTMPSLETSRPAAALAAALLPAPQK